MRAQLGQHGEERIELAEVRSRLFLIRHERVQLRLTQSTRTQYTDDMSIIDDTNDLAMCAQAQVRLI